MGIENRDYRSWLLKRMGEASLHPYKNIEFLRAHQDFDAGEVLHAGDAGAALEDLQASPLGTGAASEYQPTG